jgi:hypothetical protein
MNKVAIERLVKEMSQSDIEVLLSVLEVELKDRYYAENPSPDDLYNDVYMPEDKFLELETFSEGIH